MLEDLRSGEATRYTVCFIPPVSLGSGVEAAQEILGGFCFVRSIAVALISAPSRGSMAVPDIPDARDPPTLLPALPAGAPACRVGACSVDGVAGGRQ